jgi:phage shock protein PspC (stress-responsive transcriptional regulator)
MKKNFTVNITGKIFHIDEDAYTILTDVIQLYETELKDTVMKESIIEELKYIIACKLSKTHSQFEQKVITKTMVQTVLTNFGIIPNDSSEQIHKNKKLLRSQENKIVGGVCSGFAMFFNISSLLFRVIFILLSFVFGLGIFLYLGMWLFIPLANTSLKKLSALSLPFTPENIIQYNANDTTQMSKSKKFLFFEQFIKFIISPTPEYRISNVSILISIYKFILACVLIGLSVFFLSGMILFFTNSNASSYFIQNITNSKQISNFVFGFSQAGSIITIALFAIIFITALFMLLKGINMMLAKNFKYHFIHRMFKIIIPLSLSILCVLASYTYIQFLFVEKQQTVFSYFHTHRKNINIDFFEEKYEYTQLSEKWTLLRDGLYGLPEFDIKISETDTVKIVVLKKSYGRTLYNAEKNCNYIKYEPVIRNDTLLLQPFFKIENNKWRGQNVKIIIHIPEGKKFNISRNLASALKKRQTDDIIESRTTYIMTSEGIKSL